jgi:hypothetical protein
VATEYVFVVPRPVNDWADRVSRVVQVTPSADPAIVKFFGSRPGASLPEVSE